MLPVFWQLVDTDAEKMIAEGTGLGGLMKQLRRHMDEEGYRTPQGYIPSGNLGIYWNAVQEPVEEPAQ